jgi:antitoxin (DNA-binding transcriptional repressor) of toxin-antitoxin stability system
MTKVTIHVAKTNLSKLIAQVEAGEEVVICRGDEEVVRMVPVKPANENAGAIRPGRGSWKGHIRHTADGVRENQVPWGSPGVWDGKSPR